MPSSACAPCGAFKVPYASVEGGDSNMVWKEISVTVMAVADKSSALGPAAPPKASPPPRKARKTGPGTEKAEEAPAEEMATVEWTVKLPVLVNSKALAEGEQLRIWKTKK